MRWGLGVALQAWQSRAQRQEPFRTKRASAYGKECASLQARTWMGGPVLLVSQHRQRVLAATCAQAAPQKVLY